MYNSLFKSLILGESSGIQKIYDLVFPKVLKFVLQNSGSKDEAKDTFQKTLLQIQYKVDRFS